MEISHQFLSSESSVSLWLNERIPLQPTGALKAVRETLRDALLELRLPDRDLLSCCYTSQDQKDETREVDVENLVIYNIGTGNFSGLTQRGVHFRRRREMPPPSPSTKAFAHHYDYRFIERPTPRMGPNFCFHLPRGSVLKRPEEVWWWATQAPRMAYVPLAGRPFSLYVELETRIGGSGVANFIKPLLDGIVCAMHNDPFPSSEAIARLSRGWGRGVADIHSRLLNPPNPFLGPRAVLAKHQANSDTSVRWAPADHLCEECTVVVLPSDEQRCWVMVAAID